MRSKKLGVANITGRDRCAMRIDDKRDGGTADGGTASPGRVQDAGRWVDSRALFGLRDEVVIKHGDQMYKLRITRYGKLILNK